MRQWVRVRKATAGRADEDHVLSVYPLEEYDDALIAYIEKNVMAWAEEHPEPVYPTWLEYLARYCGAPGKIELVPFGFAEEVHGVLPETYIHWLMTHRIPADTAQKLGLQPKEGV
jgi:hypothetical protein